MDDGQGVQAEEVHLQHSDILYVMSIQLGGPHLLVRFLVFGEADRDVFGQSGRAYDGRTGVLSNLPDTAFQLFGIVEHLLVDFRTVFKLIDEFRNKPVAVFQIHLDISVLKSLLVGLSFDFHHLESRFELVQLGIEEIFLGLFLSQMVWHHLGQTVGFVYRDMGDSCHVLDGALCRHRAEGDDAGDMVGSVGFLYILVRCRQIFEIHVYIRHVDSVRIEETLEQELVLDWVEVGDFQAVGHNGTGSGASSGAYEVAHSARSADVIRYNQEVVREAHLGDGLEFEVDARFLLFGEGVAVALPRTLIGQVTEVGY